MPAALPVFLRPLEDSDITERYVAWFADEEVTRFLDARNISRQDALEFLANGRRSGRWFQYAVCLQQGGALVGSVKIGPLAPRHGLADFVTVIGERSVWGKGVATSAIRQGIAVAFTIHGVRKLSASIDSLNQGSLRAYTGGGFAVEAVLPRQFLHRTPDGLIESDKIYVGCFNPGFRANPSLDG